MTSAGCADVPMAADPEDRSAHFASGLAEYEGFTAQTDQFPKDSAEGLRLILLGLFGEVGSLLSVAKKKRRDNEGYAAHRDATVEELGDVLWYLASTCRRTGHRLADVAHAALGAGLSLEGPSHPPSTFADLRLSHRHSQESPVGPALEATLLNLAPAVGRVVQDLSVDNDTLPVQTPQDANGLPHLFGQLILAAHLADVSLQEAARGNVRKVLSRWPLQRVWQPLADEGFDPLEQLPRRIELTFLERTSGGKQYVIQQCNGINIGDRLTDNRLEPDDYRFHDVFHLSFAAILGWSPVLRALFKVKRKSQPAIDENEDGARAIQIEEGISTWIFNHGARHGFFRDAATIDYSLLKAVHELVRGYEVQDRPLWQWELAILEGFRVFRQMRANRGGTVVANLHEHRIDFVARG